MNEELIVKTSEETQAGTLSFPAAVGNLLAAGVEYYHVDYVARRKTFYGAEGDFVVTPLTYDDLAPVAPEFSPDGLRSAILDSQQNGQKYRDFSNRAVAAGVQGYFAFLRGRRVTYWGRTGEQHTEWFPGAGPTKSD